MVGMDTLLIFPFFFIFESRIQQDPGYLLDQTFCQSQVQFTEHWLNQVHAKNEQAVLG